MRWRKGVQGGGGRTPLRGRGGKVVRILDERRQETGYTVRNNGNESAEVGKGRELSKAEKDIEYP